MQYPNEPADRESKALCKTEVSYRKEGGARKSLAKEKLKLIGGK